MVKILRIEVIPSSKKEEIIEGKPLIVKVKEAPIKDRANKAVVKLLSKYLGKRVRIISGGRSKKKLIKVG
jgi:uncharacterized protein (TIGR00251 family)